MATAIKTQLQEKDVHSPRRWGTNLECSAQVIRKTVSLHPIEHLLHKATLSSPGDIEVLSNTNKPTQGDCQEEETKKHTTNERTTKFQEKKTKQNEDNQSTRYRIEKTGYKDAQ